MAAFKVRNNRNDDGTYTLSYGKGGRKLTATMRQDGETKLWGVDDTPIRCVDTMRDAKGAWADLAREAYQHNMPLPAPEPTPAAVPLPPRREKTLPPPPSLKRSGPPSFKREKPGTPVDQPEPRLETQFAADPFDPAMKYPADHPDHPHCHTPLGVLAEIREWIVRYADRIEKINRKLADAGGAPAFNPFTPLQQSIVDCLNRELKDQDHDTSAHTATTEDEAEAADPDSDDD